MLYQLSYFRNIACSTSVGTDGFEPPKAKASRFTVCPIWPLWNMPSTKFTGHCPASFSLCLCDLYRISYPNNCRWQSYKSIHCHHLESRLSSAANQCLCDSYRIQTYNLLIRSQMLYSVELTSHHFVLVWALRDSNPRPSACKADALNQLS